MRKQLAKVEDHGHGCSPNSGVTQLGAPADLSILEIVDGPVSFVDTRNNTRQRQVYLRPAGTVVAGGSVWAASSGAVYCAVASYRHGLNVEPRFTRLPLLRFN